MATQSDGVKFQRDEVVKAIKLYQIISDAIDGEMAIKARKNVYLPIPSSCNSDVNDPFYIAYITRALYYNVTQPTRDALVGQIFLRAPMIELPELLKPIEKDVNGEGLTLVQLIRRAANYVLPYGRGGFLVDFPKTSGEVTLQELQDGGIHPTIKFYEPWTIRNWIVEKKGLTHRIRLLVLDEMIEKQLVGDSFAVELEMQHRVYRLINNKCVCSVYDDSGKEIEKSTIVDGKGNPLDFIPFTFIGSENNDSEIDSPPFYNLANLNIAHYRNSADYEESCFMLGQATMVYSGLTQDWVDTNFKNGIPFGARASVPLPEGAQPHLMQVQPNTLAFEAMVHKEEQMVAIGAKIVNPKNTVERKQAEIEIEAASQKSVLTTIKDNIELAIIQSLKYAAMFVNANEDEIKVELNDNFDLTSMTAEEIRFIIESYNDNCITFSEMRENFRRSGLAKLKDDEAKKQLLEDRAMKDSLVPKLEQDAAKAKADAQNNPSVGKQPV